MTQIRIERAPLPLPLTLPLSSISLLIFGDHCLHYVIPNRSRATQSGGTRCSLGPVKPTILSMSFRPSLSRRGGFAPIFRPILIISLASNCP